MPRGRAAWPLSAITLSTRARISVMKIEIGVCLTEKETREREREREREKDKKKDKLKEEKEEREREKGILDDAAYADIHARVAMRFTLCTCQSTPAVRMLMTPK